MTKKPDWTVACTIPDAVYEQWKKLLKENNIIFLGAQSSVRQVHSVMLMSAMDNIMCLPKEEQLSFFSQFRES